MALTAAELKVIFTGDVSDLERAQARAKAGNRAVAADTVRTFTRAGRDSSGGFNRTFRLDGANRQLDSFSGRIGLAVKALIAFGPGAAAGATTALAGLGAQAGATALGAGAMGLAFQGVGDALKAVNKAHLEPTKENLKDAEALMGRLTPQGRRMVGMLREWGREGKVLTRIGQRRMFPGLIDGMDAALTRSPEFRRIMKVISQEVGEIGERTGKALASKKWDDFFKAIEKGSPKTLDETATSIGNIAEAGKNVALALSPLAGDFSGGLVGATEDLVTWSERLDRSKGLKEFLAYARRTGPQVADTIGEVSEAVLAVSEAAAPLSGPALSALSSLANVVEKIADSDWGTPLMGGVLALGALNKVAGPVKGAVGLLTGGIGGRGGGGLPGGGHKGGVTPVFVTNPGFGGPGVPGVPGGAHKGPGRGGNLLRGAGAIAGADVAYEALFGDLYGTMPKKHGQSPIVSAGGGAFGIGGLGKKGNSGFEERRVAEATQQVTKALRERARQQRSLDMLLLSHAGVAKENVAQTRRQQLAQDLAGMSVQEYAAKVAKLPAKVWTDVAAPGSVKTSADIDALDAKYELMPAEIETLVELAGGKAAVLAADAVTGAVAGIPEKRKTHVGVDIGDSLSRLRNLQHTIDGLRGRNITNYVNYVDSGGAGRQMHGKPRADGGTIGLDVGGTVPGRRLPYADKILTWLAPGEEVISNRNGQADKHRRLLKAINAGGLATGGTVGIDGVGQFAVSGSQARFLTRTADERRAYQLSVLNAQQQVRDLQRELAERRRNKKGKPTKQLELRGLDRRIARKELEVARAELAGLTGMTAAKRQAVETKRLEAEQSMLERVKAIRDQLTGSAGIFTGTTSAARMLKNLQTDAKTGTAWAATLEKLGKAGLASGLLEQFKANGPSGSALALGSSILKTGNISALNTAQAQIEKQAGATANWAAGKTSSAVVDPRTGALVNIENFTTTPDMSTSEIAERLWFLSQVRT